jgi:hypothetical protein
VEKGDEGAEDEVEEEDDDEVEDKVEEEEGKDSAPSSTFPSIAMHILLPHASPRSQST